MKYRIMAALAGVLAAAAPAAAQTSNSVLSGAQPGVMALISATDISSMMNELGITTEMAAAPDGGTPFLVATVASGARFIFRPSACEDAANAVNCRNAIVSTAMPSSGATYDDLNNFNGTSIVTTAVNLPSEQMIVFGRNIVVVGGHSRDLFKGTVYLFLRDVQNYVDTHAGATLVAFAPTPERATKISGFGNSVVVSPAGIFGISDFAPEVDAAIANGVSASFEIDYEPGE